MPQISCKNCESKFYAKPHWIKRGWGKYCSRECHQKVQRKGKDVNCFMCGEGIYRSPKQLKASKSKKYFCGKSCQTTWRNSLVFIGRKHPQWKDGESSYRNTMIRRGLPGVCKLCSAKDIRILVVHHIDENRKNNKVDNLMWLCRNCHFLVHKYNAGSSKDMVPVA